jgi:hypothetical protein
VLVADPTAAMGTAASVNDSSVAYDLVLLAHVLTALVGLVAVVTAAGFALGLRGALRRGGPLPDSLVRYYRPGVNWVGRVLFAVPVFGVALIAMSGGEWSWSDTWVSLGMGIWAVIAVAAEAVLWPGERHLQEMVAARSAMSSTPSSDGTVVGGSTADDQGPTPDDGARCLQAGLVGLGLGVALVAVGFMMVAKP